MIDYASFKIGFEVGVASAVAGLLLIAALVFVFVWLVGKEKKWMTECVSE